MPDEITPTTKSPTLAKQAQARPKIQISIRWMIFVSLLLASLPPIYGFYKWMERTAIEKEISYVDENHLIIARNLAQAMERYANDVVSIFEHSIENFAHSAGHSSGHVMSGQNGILADFNLCFIRVLDSNNTVIHQAISSRAATKLDLSSAQAAELRVLAATDPGQTVFSGIQSFDGTPYLFLTRIQADGTLAIAALNPAYLIDLQKSIAFGERGHSMIVDQFGIVIAHPNAEWQAILKDATVLTVVPKMLARETGVAQFYSPPMQADMIAGYTFVPRTGWGVMVPQPMSELIARAKSYEKTALAVGLIVVFLLVAFSLWLSNLIATPIRNVVTTAQALSAGDLDARVAAGNGRFAITEAELLGSSFNQMIADLQSDRNRLTIALAAANEGERAKSQFLAVMSHEVRTPMHGLMGILELIKDGKLNDDQRYLLGVGQTAAKNMVGLLDSVLNFVKLETDAQTSKADEFNPADVAQTIVDLFDPLAKQKGLTLSANVPDQKLKGDPQLISQILSNLVGNAVKFTNEGNIHITSELRTDESGTDRLVFSVIDSGIGIPQDKQAAIFDEFSQVDTALARDHQGSGLGLAISTRLAQLMNGNITLKSAPEIGSNFQLDIQIEVVGG